MLNHSSRLKAQLRTATGRSSKVLKDVEGIETVVEVPDRGTLILSVRRGGGYSLRARPPHAQGEEAEGGALVAVGVLGAREALSVVPG